MRSVFNRHITFVRKIFPGHSIKGMQAKLRKEVTELGRTKNNVLKKRELIDVLLVTLSYADALGMDYEELVQWANYKIGINEKRKWVKQKDGSYQHIKP